MNIPRRYILIGVIVIVLGLLFYLIFSNIHRPGVQPGAFTLNVWGVEDEEVFASISGAYQALRPGAEIIYKQIDPLAYKKTLLNALAANEGPDVFYINNHDIPSEKDKLYPADQQQFSLEQLNSMFPAVAGQDLVASGSLLYALPLYIDSLSLLYNKDIFDQTGIVYPPKTWAEFQNLMPKLTTINQRGQIVKSAAAIGGTEKTVDAGVDLLIALFMQNTAKTMEVTDGALIDALGFSSANDAVVFYTQFANAASTAYTWNDDQENSINSFAAGKTAMILNYQSIIPRIKKKNPFLNIAGVPLPQIGGDADAPLTYANYYALAVSKQSKLPTQAWDFVIQATTNDGVVRSYQITSGHPPALKSLIAEKINDPNMSAFAKSALIARSWYHVNNEEIHRILNEMIGGVLSGQATTRDAIDTASAKIKQLY